MFYDVSLFRKDVKFLWKILINVIFIRKYLSTIKDEIWYDITTVPFPFSIKNVLEPRRINIWRREKFQSGKTLCY